LRSGGVYKVVITALARDGKSKLSFRKSLYMHRSLNRPQ
jgi:tRNA1(Val) A37 N6-methylase TrmN6